MTDLPICGYCGNPEHNHALQDHGFMPLGGDGRAYYLPMDRRYRPIEAPAQPMSPKTKLLLGIAINLALWAFAAWLIFG